MRAIVLFLNKKEQKGFLFLFLTYSSGKRPIPGQVNITNIAS